jgi:hypothetical protein
MRIAPFIAALAVPTVLLGGVAYAEQESASSLTRELTNWVESSLPEVEVGDINLRGRPYIVSERNHEVSTAYVNVSVPGSTGDVQLIVQNLDLDTDRANRVRVFATVPYKQPGRPIKTADGVLTPRAIINGKEVRVRATMRDDRITATASDGTTIGTIKVPHLRGLKIDQAALATDNGVMVGLVATHVRPGN